ncbi:unnamed protein product [Closterium sp. NIES-64]|nr:unnamed protein product [Closterium sp. NIES-64]
MAHSLPPSHHRLPDTLRAVRDHFLARCPTELTIALLEKELLAAEACIVAVGASRDDPRTPFFEGCSPSPFFPLSPLLLLSTSLVLRRPVLRLLRAGTAAAWAKGARCGGGGGGGGGGGATGGASGSGGGGGRQRRGRWQGRRRWWGWRWTRRQQGLGGRGGGGGGGGVEALAVARASSTLRRPRSGAGAEYLCVPPDPGIRTSASAAPGTRVSATPGAGEAAALGACASAPLVLSRLQHCTPSHWTQVLLAASFVTSTALEPLARPVAVSLADPSGGPVIATSSTVLPCPAVPVGHTRAAPHSSSFPPTTAPLQTLHMDVWGPARVRGQGQERYFLIVVDDYSCYTTVFPLRTKGEVPDVLIPWIRRARLQLSECFHLDFPVLRLHSDRGGEFSSDLLAAYCAEHGIEQSFTLPASPQQNGVAERRIGLVMEVARTSLIHAAAPHFLWPFAVRYAAHQLNLWPRVSLPETSPTLLWTEEVGDASRFRDVTFDESVPYYLLFPYRTAPLPPPPLFLVPGAAVVDPLPPQGTAPSGVSQVDPVEPVEVAVDSRPAGGAEPGGAETGGTEPGGAEPGVRSLGVLSLGGAEPGGAELGGAELGGAEPQSPESGGSESGGAESRSPTLGGALSLEQLRVWPLFLQFCTR